MEKEKRITEKCLTDIGNVGNLTQGAAERAAKRVTKRAAERAAETVLLLFTAYSIGCGGGLQASSQNTQNTPSNEVSDESCASERVSVDALGGLCTASVCYQTRLYREHGRLVLDTGNGAVRVVVEDAPFIDTVYGVSINGQRTRSSSECGSLEYETDRAACRRAWHDERSYRGLAEISRLALERAENRAERRCEEYRRRAFAYRPRGNI